VGLGWCVGLPGAMLVVLSGLFAARVCVCVAGAGVNPVVRGLGLEGDARGRVFTTALMHAQARDDVFVLGDSAAVLGESADEQGGRCVLRCCPVWPACPPARPPRVVMNLTGLARGA
jgi:hypothetical protein